MKPSETSNGKKNYISYLCFLLKYLLYILVCISLVENNLLNIFKAFSNLSLFLIKRRQFLKNISKF
jgi:hypothetical protein